MPTPTRLYRVAITSHRRDRTIETEVAPSACGDLVTSALDNPDITEIALSWLDGHTNTYRRI